MAAYCLDMAVGEFGRSVESALSKVEGKNKKEIEAKSERVLSKWLDIAPKYRNPMGQTRSP